MLNKISKLIIALGFIALAASPLLVFAQANPIGGPLQLPIPGVNEPATKPATTSPKPNSATTTPPAQTPTELPVYNAGVDRSIQDYLCTPSQPADGHDLERCVNRLYRFGISAGALVLVFLIIYAGYIYITSDESGKTKAKGYIKNSLTGMGILLGSYVLLNFINPSLVTFKPIQPPIFNAADLPKCEELGLGINCTIGEGESVAGNESSIPTPGSEKDGVTYGGSTFRGFPRFGQCDSPWGPTRYGPAGAGTYCAASCGPSSFAAIVKFYAKNGGASGGESVDPSVIGNLAIQGGYRKTSGGTNHGFVAAVAPKYGLQVKAVDWNAAVAYLEKGIPVHTSSNWKGGGFKTNVSGGHFIVMIAKKGNTIYIADSWKTNITAVQADKMRSYYNRGFAVISPNYTPPAP